ncbi:CUGBP Elav-like family member 2 isoform X2 [Watersipora subatra]|uniref:CUGBP Elav-like family member 2 isoform X2 n=1 Tax=Watersipora subatra TaxID=2589382 RepID=UPI00355C9898
MAQDELHGRHTLPGMHHPIQMKPADNEKKNVEDRKLFIGMISKKLAENDIKTMFQPYGAIDDCMILRDTSGGSRGCAFVTFASRQSALSAIQSMHHNLTMEGCASPIVVKFADTQKDKDIRIKLPPNNNIVTANPYPSSLPAGMSPHQYLALLQQMGLTVPPNPMDVASMNYHNMQNLQNMGMLTGQSLIGIPALSATPLSMTRTVTSPTNGHTLAINSMPGNLKIASSSTSSNSTGIPVAPVAQAAPQPAAGGALTPAQMQQQFNLAGAPVQPPLAGYPAHTLGGGPISALQTQHSIDATLAQAYSGLTQYAASFPHAYAPVQTALAADTPAGKQTEGPDGANLFIYHLPQDFTDLDLLHHFQSFGTVISSKVFIDKQTSLSKCFGFVSYDNPASAQAAIATMNGYQIKMKRLKVQLKRSKNENKPY